MIDLHPLCSAFPQMKPHEFNRLKDSIKDDGQELPIVMLDGQVLDGRHRMKACLELGIEPDTVEYAGDDPLGFVMRLNLQRRHLSTSQRSMVAGKIANIKVGSTGGKGRIESPNSDSQSRAQAAKQLNVSRASVSVAKKIQATAPQNVINAVESGELSLNAAEKIVTHVEPSTAEILTLTELKKAAAAASNTRAHHINNARQHAESLLNALNAAALVDGVPGDLFKLSQNLRDAARRLQEITVTQ